MDITSIVMKGNKSRRTDLIGFSKRAFIGSFLATVFYLSIGAIESRNIEYARLTDQFLPENHKSLCNKMTNVTLGLAGCQLAKAAIIPARQSK